MSWLEKIKKPQDLQKVSIADLGKIATEVRQRIIEVCAKNGGHLASSLGATDLTVALLKVFNPAIDSVVYDVGHQAYAYKILTERNDRFDTLRQLNGISGFNNSAESQYDAFSVGHSSTSISAALGIAVAKQKKKEPGYSIAIIGDGALTGGMAFEAMNHAGHLQTDKLLVILNDNEMSISKNVGALQKYMSHMLVSRSYNRLKKQVWDFAEGLPQRIRSKFVYGAQKLEESMINILVPNIIFEDLGFKYVGPVDGHDIQHLVHILNKVKNNMTGPVLVHVVTKKGKGYDIAEDNASKFHGTGPFDPCSGKVCGNAEKTFSQVFGETMCELAKSDDSIVAITAAMGAGTGLNKFEKLYPDRFFDVGIAEQHAVTFAGGLAIKGLHPVIAIYSTFAQRALDQMIHDVALQNLPVVFCLDRAGLVGEDGATHHGAFDISFMQYVPNLKILAPASAQELKDMLRLALTNPIGPTVIRYPRGRACGCKFSNQDVNWGKAEIVQEGNDIAVIGVGDAYYTAEELVHIFKEKNQKDAWLINLRSIKPLDTALLLSLRGKVRQLIIIEHNTVIGGVGQTIKALLSPQIEDIRCYGFPDQFIPHGTTAELLEQIGLTANHIYLSC